MARSVVTGPGINLQRWKAFRRAQLDFDFSPLCIVCLVAWPISQNVLISQLQAGFCCGIRNLIRILDCEETTTSHLRDFSKERRPVEFL